MAFILLGILNSQAAAGGGGIDPSTLNPDLWLDASDASTISESGGSVSQWDNKGTLENLTQATSADQPTTGVTTINGLNVIDFQSDFLNGTTASNWKFLHDGTTYFFAMVTVSRGTGLNTFFGTTNRTSEIGATHNSLDSTNESWNYLVSGGASGTTVLSIADNGFFPRNEALISSALIDSNAAIAERIDYFRNNTQGALTNSNNESVSGSNPTNNFQVGATRNAALLTDDASIGELIIVSGADATETNRQAVVNYLNAKWSVF